MNMVRDMEEGQTLCETAQALQHADGGACSVTAVALSLQLVVAGQDEVGVLSDERLQPLYHAEVRSHLLHTP